MDSYLLHCLQQKIRRALQAHLFKTSVVELVLHLQRHFSLKLLNVPVHFPLFQVFSRKACHVKKDSKASDIKGLQ